MKKRILSIPLILCLLLLTACGTDEAKIADAQNAYRELVKAHNLTVEAHREILDPSMDDELASMEAKLRTYPSLNLNGLSGEKLDELILEMNEMRDRYGACMIRIDEIKNEESASRITQTSFTLVNGTYITFTGVTLKEEGAPGEAAAILEGLDPFEPENELVGLSVHADHDNTPWILTLTAEDAVYELTIDPSSLSESGNNILTVVIENEEADHITLGLT
ncbi:MAG: hypothetical protein K6F53_09195 [Lachnospiraceae bacterium]|nr:hypothetical protein [Lachnospiraceae bacterium]